MRTPPLAQQLDQAEAELVERRERIEADMAQLGTDEAEHRNRWTALISVVPGFERGSSFTPLEHQHVHFSAGEAPTPLLRPARLPQDCDGALIGLIPDETWPAWLRRCWQDTPRPADEQAAVVMSVDGASFVDDDDTTPQGDEDEQRRALAAAASDAAAKNNTILM